MFCRDNIELESVEIPDHCMYRLWRHGICQLCIPTNINSMNNKLQPSNIIALKLADHIIHIIHANYHGTLDIHYLYTCFAFRYTSCHHGPVY